MRGRLSDSDLTSANAGFGSAPSGCSSVTWETGIKHEKSSSSWLKKLFSFFVLKIGRASFKKKLFLGLLHDLIDHLGGETVETIWMGWMILKFPGVELMVSGSS